jgi:hypothetical protein
VRVTSIASIAVLHMLCACDTQAPVSPLRSGTYTFQHRDSEFPNSEGFPVLLAISGVEVTITNPKAYGPIPKGKIESATLMWHAKSQQWILGHSQTDCDAEEVGGCTGGPHVVDFKSRTIWTCEGGP